MAAALKLTQDDEKLSRKPPLGEKRPKLRLVWENPELTHGTQKEKPEVKPEPSYGRVLYNYFRDYDPATGRYVESDPIGLRGGGNLYAYVQGNPVGWFDQFGLSRADVERIRENISILFPEYYNDVATISFEDLPGRYDGNTPLDTGNIVLDVIYLKECLEEYEQENLFRILVHEYQHSNDILSANSFEIEYMRWQGILEERGIPWARHDEIYDNATNALWNTPNEYIVAKCGCGE